MRTLILFDSQSLAVRPWLLFQMATRKSHLKVLLILVKKKGKRFADAVFSVSLSRLTDTSLLPPFVIVWKGLNCITCKWRDLIFAHYLFIRENEHNISGSPEGGGREEKGGGGGDQTEGRMMPRKSEVADLHDWLWNVWQLWYDTKKVSVLKSACPGVCLRMRMFFIWKVKVNH